MQQTDDKILLEKLPAVVWKLIFERMGTDFPLLETCSKTTNFFRDLVFRSGHVSLGPGKILPRVFREWIDTDKHSDSEPVLLLKTLSNSQHRIKMFDICVNGSFRPTNEMINSFLNAQRDSLETFHISCLEIGPSALVLDFPKNGKLRIMKILRIVTEEYRMCRVGLKQSVDFAQPVYESLHALESLTLSIGGYDDWSDFLDCTNLNKSCEAMKILRLLDYCTQEQILEREVGICGTLYAACELFPNLDTAEIPAVPFFMDSVLPKNIGRQLKRLTLNKLSSDVHCFDKFITSYSGELCAKILANPDRNPEDFRMEIEREKEPLFAGGKYPDDMYQIFATKGRWDPRRLIERPYCITALRNLEILRLKCDTGEWGPTVVSIPDLLNMKSLKVLDFCGGMPKQIPQEMMTKLQERFTVL